MPESMNPEIEYKPINDYPNYLVGADGSVWSCLKRGSARLTITKSTWHRLKPGNARGGYRNVVLSNPTGKRTFLVHTLVLEAFVGPCPPGMESCHAPDRTRSNNAINNLRWGTPLENAEDRDRDGNTARGTNNGNSRLTEEAVREIRFANGKGAIMQMAKKFGISRVSVHNIRKRQTWRHVL